MSHFNLSLRPDCNSTMAALVDAATQLHTPHEKFTEHDVYSAAYCQFSSNSTLAEEAKKLWIKSSSYGYQPSRGVAAFAIAAFGVALLVHLYQLVRSRRWSYIAVVLGIALQIYGWYERFLAGDDIQTGYVIQLAVLTIAPTFFSAALYTLFSLTAAAESPALLPGLKPRTYMWLFVVIDFVTLVIQAAGGAIAAGDVSLSVFNVGCHIMLAGIVLQLVTTFGFLAVFGIYFHRLPRERIDALSIRRGSGRVFWGVLFIAAMIIIRGCYRTAELSDGLFGSLATTQIALILCDCIPMILVVYCLAATHPLHTLNSSPSASSSRGSTASVEEEKAVEGSSTSQLGELNRV